VPAGSGRWRAVPRRAVRRDRRDGCRERRGVPRRGRAHGRRRLGARRSGAAAGARAALALADRWSAGAAPGVRDASAGQVAARRHVLVGEPAQGEETGSKSAVPSTVYSTAACGSRASARGRTRRARASRRPYSRSRSSLSGMPAASVAARAASSCATAANCGSYTWPSASSAARARG
jgi:hypothetical protein